VVQEVPCGRWRWCLRSSPTKLQVPKAIAIAGVAETQYVRHPDRGISAASLLAEAGQLGVRDAGLELRDVDGLGVASFSLAPDHAIDLAWKLGIHPKWLMDDANGGVSAFNLIHHAMRAIESGDATNILIICGDVIRDFDALANNYNVVTRDLLAPMRYGGPNSLFALLTLRHMTRHGLGREDYAQIPILQRRWAALNPGAVYRETLDLEAYLAAPIVCYPLCVYDCPPIVAGANAAVVSAQHSEARLEVKIRNLALIYNVDNQEGDGLNSGLAHIREALFTGAKLQPRDIDILSIYDDYPVMVLAQLGDLGYLSASTIKAFIRDELASGNLKLNTSGGQLSAGQAGLAGSMHGLVEAVRQLRGQAGDRQVKQARTALVTGYGMVLYRYGAAAAAAILEAA